MGNLDLARLDRDVASAARALARWRGAEHVDPDEDPIAPFRHVAGQSMYEALGAERVALHEEHLRAALRRWVRVLLHARVGLPLERELRVRQSAKVGELTLEPPRLVSWREAWRGLVASRASAERSAWLAALAQCAPPVAEVERERAARRIEVDARLAAAVDVAPALESAERFLDASDDLYRDVARPLAKEARTGADVLPLALAHAAVEGWPARLGPRWVHEVSGPFAFARAELGRLPAPMGASSFARALGAFGRALRVAAVAPSLPFALRVDPLGGEENHWAWVFAAIPTQRVFHVRALGLTARVSAAQARAMSIAALVTSRIEAARLLLLHGAPFEETTARALGRPLPGAIAGAWPTWNDDAVSRWTGLVGVPARLRELVDRFDEDWFRNPRAADHLRARFSASPVSEPKDGEQPAVRALDLARALEAALA
jgi:hypothetical protein